MVRWLDGFFWVQFDLLKKKMPLDVSFLKVIFFKKSGNTSSKTHRVQSLNFSKRRYSDARVRPSERAASVMLPWCFSSA
jgi:hypothetical protein